jgi:superfamily II DNA/RNA helicase
VEDWKKKWGRLKSWSQYKLHPSLMQSIKEYKFFSPTPIQEKTLHAAVLEDKDVVGVAETVLLNPISLISFFLFLFNKFIIIK